jgi:DNA-binding LytR/AlgR family response regulator
MKKIIETRIFVPPQFTKEYVAIGGRQRANPADILLLEADINYTIIHFLSGEKIIVATTLKKLEKRFESFNFFRPHKSCMVNMKCIKFFSKATNSLQMTDNQSIMVSRRKVSELKKCLVMPTVKSNHLP